ncbi:MAG: sulfotransferase domain-containing protein [Nitrospirota bacterium]
MVIFVAGMSRSGSMWTFNVTREGIRKSGRKPLPEIVPSDERPVIQKALASPPREDGVYCIKTHLLLRPGLPNVKIICTYRDVREAMVSYMQFVRCDFTRGLEAARSMMSVVDYYFLEHRENILRIRYDRILSKPVEVIREILTFLDLSVSPRDISLIAEQFSRDRIAKFIESLNAVRVTGNGAIADPGLRGGFETVGNFDGSFRVYDKKSAFQSRHITKSGERWREFLTGEQQAQVMAITSDWLVKYGFPP